MAYYSDFNYLRTSELPELLHSVGSITNEQQAARFISDAEHIIDAYVGPSPRFYIGATGHTGAIASGAVAFPGNNWGERHPNYWAKGGVYVEIIDGTQAGQRRLVIASTNNSVTLASGFSSAIADGTLYNFSQESHFPRWQDRMNVDMPYMPFVLRRATALQVEYGFLFGSEPYGLSESTVADGELGEVQSRSYASGYAESRAVGGASQKQGLALLIAPRARAELRGLLTSTGYLRG